MSTRAEREAERELRRQARTRRPRPADRHVSPELRAELEQFFAGYQRSEGAPLVLTRRTREHLRAEGVDVSATAESARMLVSGGAVLTWLADRTQPR